MGALVTMLAMGVLQLALTLHVRNTLVSCASEGAHVAALADRVPADGARRAQELAGAALAGRNVDVTASSVTRGGVALVTVTVSSPVPVLGLWGVGSVEVTAHAIEEGGSG